jgi:hypothetical protein
MLNLISRNQPAINFAKTVRNVVTLKNEYAKVIMDRSKPITEELISSLIAQGIMSYAGRNPVPALDADGNLQRTDLDLLSFLVPLAARHAVVEIPEYKNRRQVVKMEGKRKIGSGNFGPITSLVSNRDVFSFSIKIHDKTIVVEDALGREKLGDFRNYLVVDCNGEIYNGWNKIVWNTSVAENAFLNNKRLWTGNSVQFKYFVHPNRWQSVFGAPHLLKKMLLARITDEARFYRAEIKRLHALGIYSTSAEFNGKCKTVRETICRGATKKIAVPTMEMLLTLPKFIGSYEALPNNVDGLIEAYRRQRILTYTWKPAVQFVVRANEAAFFRFGLNADGKGKIAHWLKSRRWILAKKSPRSALYQTMKLSDKISILYRLKTKTEHVSV